MRRHLFEILLKVSRYLARLAGRGFAGRRSIPTEALAAANFLPERGAVVVDGGANRGEWSRELLRVASPRIANIYAFEPAPDHHRSIASIGDSRIEIVGAALSNVPGEVQLYGHQPGASIASVYQRDLAHYGLEMVPQCRAPATTIDLFMDERGLDRIDFLKLDVEGHELQVLKGASRSLEGGAIRALSFEFGGCNIDSLTYLRDFWNLLSPGYDIYIVNPLTTVYRIASYDEWWECFLTTNFVAVLKCDSRR